jgi:hypothetical protein
MKLKKLAKVLNYAFVRVTIKGDESKNVYCDTGLDHDVIKQYGEYKVNNIEVLLPEKLKHGLLDIYLKDKRTKITP